jgi:hypothetical protein
MNPMISMIFQSPGIFSFLCDQRVYPMKETDTYLLDSLGNEEPAHNEMCLKWSKRKNPKGLSVEVDEPYSDIYNRYDAAINFVRQKAAENNFNYYKTYLRQIIPDEEHRYDAIVSNFKVLRNKVKERMDDPYSDEINLIYRLVNRNEYISKNTRRPGLVVKMFHAWYYHQDVFVKVYLYDPQCYSYRSSIRENFMNEVIFQSYAKKLNDQVDFISPEVYSWGKIRRFFLGGERYPYECLFIIMEHIPFVTLKEAVYSTEHMRHIYQRVEDIDDELSSHLLHHNDLHAGNIMVSPTSSPSKSGDKSPSKSGDKSPSKSGDKSPYPEIVILDFGEASLGPTKPIFKRGIQ